MEFEAFQCVTLALILGVASFILGRWLKIPAILFYLISGAAAGPLGLNVINPQSLGSGLMILVEIGVAIILFEGGLALSPHSFKVESSGIRRILIITIPLTGIGAALLSHYFLNLPWRFALFFGTLIVVTGPTVIGSILKSVYLTRKLEILLNWESLWGDVIGVLLSALALELIGAAAADPIDSAGHLAKIFAIRMAAGVILGVASGFILSKILLPRVARLKDPALPGLIVLSGAVGTFFLANAIMESSGPLAVAIAGFFMSHLKGETLQEVRHFKEQISSLFISMLFVLLSAYVNPLPYMDLWPQMLAVALILGGVVRPLAVLSALARTPVSWPERIFISFIGPRGIIAVATASYAAFITQSHAKEMDLVLNLTVVIIFFSGAIATLICKPLATLLKVRVYASGSGILMVGINELSSAIARLAVQYVPVAFLDTNRNSCTLASALGHETVCTNYLSGDVYEEAREDGFGRLIALTRNDALNELISQKAGFYMEPQNVYRVISRPASSAIFMEPDFHKNLAFSKDFMVMRAIRKLEHRRAEVLLINASEITELSAIPLFQVVAGGKGLRVIQPEDSIENIIDSDTKVICFVPKPRG